MLDWKFRELGSQVLLSAVGPRADHLAGKRPEVAEGEAGLIRVFDLANVFSVAAIQTEILPFGVVTALNWLAVRNWPSRVAAR